MRSEHILDLPPAAAAGYEARARRVIVGIPAITLVAGALASMTLDIRLGLLAASIVLGWTQLAGL